MADQWKCSYGEPRCSCSGVLYPGTLNRLHALRTATGMAVPRTRRSEGSHPCGENGLRKPRTWGEMRPETGSWWWEDAGSADKFD